MVRTLKLSAVLAFVWVCRNERVMSAAIVAARFGYFILLDSHVSTFVIQGRMTDRVSVMGPELQFVVGRVASV